MHNKTTIIMATKEYDTDSPVTMASEPSVAFVAVSTPKAEPFIDDIHMDGLYPDDLSVMADDDETMDLEELRAMLHETIRKEYALP